MKHFFSALLLVIVASNSHAQNVGIGTTTPNQKLDIDKGRMRFTGNPGPGISQGIEFTDPAGTTLNGFVGVYNDSITGMYGFQGSNWSFLHNNKNGNIGLQGNANPRAPLSFTSTTGNKISLWGNADAAHYGLGVQGAQMQLYTDVVSSDITFGYGKSSAFTENVRIKGNGMVGIGFPNPTATLTVGRGTAIGGTARFDGTVNASHFNINTTEDTYIRGGKGGSKVFINDPATAGDVILSQSSGNVGIGTATPGAKLDVNGRLQTSAGANFGDDVGISGDLQTQGSIETDASLFVSDNATINGTVKIAGGAPGVGKVLTSDASGNASWKNGAYGNTERFQYKLVNQEGLDDANFTELYNFGTGSGNATGGDDFGMTVYTPSDGLYHFDVNVYATFNGGTAGQESVILAVMPNLSSSSGVSVKTGLNYTICTVDKSFDLYMKSPSSSIIIRAVPLNNLPDYQIKTVVTGYKIAD